MMLSKNEMPASHPDLNALAAFADGRLDPGERSALAAHLAECDECRAILATLTRAGRTPASSLRWLPFAATIVLGASAGAIVWQLQRTPQAVPASAQPPVGTAPALPPPAAPPLSASPAAPPPSAAPATSTAPGPSRGTGTPDRTRSGERTVAGKKFKLIAGEWVDAAYDPLDVLPVREVRGADARAAVLAETTALGPYAALGPRVTVVFGGTVYKFHQ